MKVLGAIIFAIVSLNSFAMEHEYALQEMNRSFQMEREKTIIDTNITRDPWISEGQVFPVYTLNSTNSTYFEYIYSPFSPAQGEGIERKLKQESLEQCRTMSEEEFSYQSELYNKDEYQLFVNFTHKQLEKDTFLNDENVTYLKYSCLISVRLTKKDQL